MTNPKPDFHVLLQVLLEHKVDFIIVGGVCAVLHGAPLNTFDLDLVHARAPDNLDRLCQALQALDAHYREKSDRRVIPQPSHLMSSGHHLLMTKAGPLDLLGTIGKGRGYEELLEHTIELEVGPNQVVRLLDLKTLIQIKEETGRDRDKAVLPILRQTLTEKLKLE